ncbi:MAG: ABC transporter permease [Candidatus Diapherotrites archaeon]
MLKILKIAYKELKLIKSQRIALALIFLYPIIVILALALAFSGSTFFGGLGKTGMDEVPVTVYLPKNSQFFDDADFRQKLALTENIRIIWANREELVEEAVQQKKSKVGIIVHEPSEERGKIYVDIFFDNSSLLASRMMASYARIALDRVSGEKSKEILTSIWEDLSIIQGNLNTEISKTGDFINELEGAEKKLADLNRSINEIDLVTLKSQLGEFDHHYLDSKQQIDEAKNEAGLTQSNLVVYRGKLISARNELNIYSSELKSIRDSVRSARYMSVQPLTSELQSIENDLTSEINKIDGAISDITMAIADIDSAVLKLNDVKAKLDLAGQRLNSANEAVEGFKVTINSMDETLTEVKELIAEASESQKATTTDLLATKELLDGLVETLREFRKYDPGYLVRPVEVNEKKMYEVNDLAIIAPVAIALVLLLTCMLLTSVSVVLEREQGVAFRMQMSPTSKFSWLLGKTLGQMVFAMIVAMIIVFIAVLFFGVPIKGVTPDPLVIFFGIFELFFILLIISFAFINMGLFITNFLNTQSTAILASLLIMVPLLFLSGTFFPLEFMPEAVSWVSSVLPLTVATDLLMGTMVKGTFILWLIPGMLVLFIPSVFLFLITALYPKI